METLPTRELSLVDLEALESFAREWAAPELRELLIRLAQCLREGAEVVAFDDATSLTTNQVAERTGMSRPHLYKLMDQGVLPFDRVGRDRRVRIQDLLNFEVQRQAAREELAQRFARKEQTDRQITQEIADLL